MPETSTSRSPGKVIPLTLCEIVEESPTAISEFQTNWNNSVPILFVISTYIGAPSGINKLLYILTSIKPESIVADVNESKVIDFCWGTSATVSTTTSALPPPAVIAVSIISIKDVGIASENDIGSVFWLPILSKLINPICASINSEISSKPTESYPIVNLVWELSISMELAYWTIFFSIGSIFSLSPTVTVSNWIVLLKTNIESFPSPRG